MFGFSEMEDEHMSIFPTFESNLVLLVGRICKEQS